MARIPKEFTNHIVPTTLIIDNLFIKKLNKFAEEIYESEETRNGRTFKEVRKNCFSGLALETAAAKVLNGIRNPKNFDLFDKDSYYWDVKDDKFKYEIKRHPEKSKLKYYSFYYNNVKTLCKNSNNIDFVLVGDWKNLQNNVIGIEWYFIARAGNFRKYINESNIFKGGYYYNHHNDNCTRFKEL